MELYLTREATRGARRGLPWGLAHFHWRFLRKVAALEALRDERDFEALDVLLSFGRHARVLALIEGAEGSALSARERVVRQAVCLCALGRDAEARRVLVEAWRRSEDPVLAFETAWLSRLRGWEPVVLPPSPDFDWLIAARFEARPPPLEEAREERWARSNWLYAEDRRHTPLDAGDVGLHHFPFEPDVTLGAAVLAARGGAAFAEGEAARESLEVATRAWPELWSVLTVDPLFQPCVLPPRAVPLVLPAELSERMQLWNVVEVSPQPGDGSARVPLGAYCPEPYDFDTHGLFTLEDTLGTLGVWDTRERVPPFHVEVSQLADRFLGRYDTDVLAPLRALAPHAGDVWFFLRDINRETVDEVYLREGRYGFRRWSLADVESDPDAPFINPVHALLRRLVERPEPRFRSEHFQRFLRHFSPSAP